MTEQHERIIIYLALIAATIVFALTGHHYWAAATFILLILC